MDYAILFGKSTEIGGETLYNEMNFNDDCIANVPCKRYNSEKIHGEKG